MRQIEGKYGRSFKVFGLVGDPFVTGIVAAKLGIDTYLLATRSCLRVDNLDAEWGEGERRRMFLRGVSEADEYPLSDVAWTITAIRNRDSRIFDEAIKLSLGPVGWMEVVDACEEAVQPQYVSTAELGRRLRQLHATDKLVEV